MGKVKIGKTYKVKQTPNGKNGSNGPGTRQGESAEVSVIRSTHNGKGIMYLCKMTKVSDSMRSNGYITGVNYNYHDYELEIGPYNKESILEEIEEINKKKSKLDNEQSELQSKIDWMDEVDVSEFDEDEYKVWKTLTLLEDGSVSKLIKMREIANLIKG